MEPEKKRRGRWKPGESGNPKGSKPIPGEVKAAKHLNNAQVTLAIQKYYGMSITELKEARQNPKTPAGDCMIISVMLYAITKGDYRRLDALLDRACGRVKQVVEHQGGQTLEIKQEERRKAFIKMLKDNPEAAVALEHIAKVGEGIHEAESEDEDAC